MEVIMKRYIPLFLGLAVLGLFIFGCDTIVDQEPIHDVLKKGQAENVTDVGKMVPFKGKGTWEYAAPPDIGDEVVIIVLIEGTATHLGRFEALWTARFSFDYEGMLGFIGDYLSHSGIFTAANGDELYDEGDASTGTEHDFYEPLGTGFLMTGIHLVGGTGRFENAEGLYDLSVNVSEDDPFVGTWEIEGEISSVGSTRGGR